VAGLSNRRNLLALSEIPNHKRSRQKLPDEKNKAQYSKAADVRIEKTTHYIDLAIKEDWEYCPKCGGHLGHKKSWRKENT
jgi:hypothetical protein